MFACVCDAHGRLPAIGCRLMLGRMTEESRGYEVEVQSAEYLQPRGGRAITNKDNVRGERADVQTFIKTGDLMNRFDLEFEADSPRTRLRISIFQRFCVIIVRKEI